MMIFFTEQQNTDSLYVAPQVYTDYGMGKEVEEENTFFHQFC